MRKFTFRLLLASLMVLPSIIAFSQSMPHEELTPNVCLMKGYQAPAMESLNSIFSEDFSSGTFPPTGWTIVGDGQLNWIESATSHGGGTAPEAKFYYSPYFDGNSRFVTPVIATSGYTEVLLSFEHFLNEYGSTPGYFLYVETTSDGGTTWNEVWSLEDPGANIGPETLRLLISNGDVGSDNFQIAFRFDGNSYELDAWFIDDVMVEEALEFDAAAVSVDMPWLLSTGTNLEPGATVLNNGNATVTFDVTFEILDGTSAIYSEVQTVTDLAAYETVSITYPTWVAITGSFVATVTTNLTGDANPDNDMVSLDIEVIEELVPVKPLYEEFTSSTCGPCVPANIAIDGVLGANPDEYTLIKYQMNWPGSGDPYYTEEGGVRKDYYGVGWAPDLYINSNQLDPAASLTQAIFDYYANELTALEIEITEASIDQDLNLTVTADLTPLANYAAGLTAHMVVVEKLTVANVGTNGETEWHNVMMKMLPDASGTTLDALTTGVQVNLSEAYNMDATNMETPNDLAVVVFVQDESDKSIVQSAVLDVNGIFDSYEVAITIEDKDGNPIEGAEVIMEENGTQITDASGMAPFTNVFPGTYAIDASATGFFDGSGSVSVIDQNESVTITLEAYDYYYYEMFDFEIPATWTTHATEPDNIFWSGGYTVLFRQSATSDPLMLVSEAIDVEPANMIYFDAGVSYGDCPTVFGIMTDPTDPSTFTGWDTIYPPGPTDWETYEYDLSDIDTDVYFAWSNISSMFTGCGIDNVIITAGGTTEGCEDFDALTVGGYVAEQLGGMWTTWGGAPGTAEDAMVSDMYSSSPENGFVVDTGTIDLIYQLSEAPITSGQWLYTNMVYVPTGTSGYFNVQSEPTPGEDWVVEIFFNDDGTGNVTENSNVNDFTYAQDTWILVEINFDLDNAGVEVLFDGVEFYQWNNTFTIGGIRYFGSDTGGSPGAYYDDVCFSDEGWLIDGVEEQLASTTHLFPNPATDVVNIESDYNMESIIIYNFAGQVILTETVNSTTYRVNTSNLDSGIYLFQIETQEGRIAKRIVIE